MNSTAAPDDNTPITLRRVTQTWWPLATSWLLMGFELPLLSAVVARLEAPKIHLAAYAGVVFPLALVIESPIVMLLAASTALSRDQSAYRKLRRFMHRAGALLTALHVLIAFTPLYDVVAAGIIGAPAEVIEPARVGLMIMTPWTWSIAFRRFHQGVLIRFGRTRAVGFGTLVRLIVNVSILAAGYVIGIVPGIIVATSAVAAGVLAEAVYVGMVVKPVLRSELAAAPAAAIPLTTRAFARFYVPLALTALLSLISQPIGTAATSRMPRPLDSLAVWPVVHGLLFITQSVGIAFNEVVVTLIGKPGATVALRRFTAILALGTMAFLLLVAATPLAPLWFGVASGLPPALAAMAERSLWLALPLPALAAVESWYQGALVHHHRTRGITEAVALFLLGNAVLLGAGIAWGGAAGLYVSLAAFAVSGGLQTIWLRRRTRDLAL